jgi:hypothetical protein
VSDLHTVNGRPIPADSAYIAKLAVITTRVIEPSGPEIDAAREHYAGLSPERRAQIEAEWE